jgi:hypothetical protein
MLHTTTYHELLILRNDIIANQQRSPSYALFFAQKIKTFNARNAMQIELALKKLEAMVEKHVEHDEEDKPVFAERDGITVKYKFKSEEDEKAFHEAYAAFMNRNLTIEI